MKRTCVLLSLIFGPLALALTGCTVGSFPNTAVPEVGTQVRPPLQGSVYGGHAPLVGARVYVLSPSQTANSGLATSLMNSTQGAGGFPVAIDSSGGASNGMYYVTTDSTGSYNLTGDYTCTVDQAVYLVAVGGTPSFPGAPNNTFGVSQIQVSNAVLGLGGTATYTITTTSTELVYVGESVVVSGLPGNLGTLLNGTTQTVTSSNTPVSPTTTTFQFTAASYLTEVNGTFASPGASVVAYPTFNPAAINMTALGLCPAADTFANSIPFIYTNEISTAAMAVAMGAFGTDAFHIGARTGGPVDSYYASYDKNAFKQALSNAKLLYDIGGGNTSTTYAGEGHIARSVTPAGNGIVPQTLMDTWGNILASCVDSQNTTATASPQCSTLFETATSTGKACTFSTSSQAYTCPTGTAAAPDIATAAFNIEHFPAGTGNTAFVNTLYTLPTGNVPFAPNLTAQPNDFSVAIAFTAPQTAGSATNLINGPQVIAIDGGNYVGIESNYTGEATGELQEGVWIGSFYTQTAKLFASTGTPDYATMAAGDMPYTINARSEAIDYSGNVWMSLPSANAILALSNTGVFVADYDPTSGNSQVNQNLGASLDGYSGSYNVYSGGYSNNNELKIGATYNSSAGTYTVADVPANGGPAGSPFSTAACLNIPYANALDPAGHLYSGNIGTGTICALNTTTGAATYTQTGFTNSAPSGYSYGPSYISVDGNSVVWGVNANNNQLLGYTYGSTTLKTYTGGGMNVPCATAVDGGNNIWVGNGATWSVSEFSNSGTALSPAAHTTGTGSSTASIGGFNPQLQSTLTLNGTTVFNPNGGVTDCGNPAIDRAGDVWMAYQGIGSGVGVVFEILGIAQPVVTPISLATFGNGSTGLLGQRPY